MGKNFSNFAEVRSGDFLKIFWTNAISKNEHGHSVIFLGLTSRNGIERVRYWSSNQPEGFGVKSVPRQKIAHALFSRLEHPEKIARWPSLPTRDTYLAGLLHKESTWAEAKRKSGIP